MIKQIKHKATLLYYDGPELIEAQDQIGGSYIGLALDSDTNVFKFLVVGVQPTILRQLRRGEMDLRSLILDSEKFGWYMCETNNIEDPINLEEQNVESIPDSLLPNKNVFVNAPQDKQNFAMSEANNRSNFVVHLKFEPERSDQAHNLNLRDYGELILGLNSLVVSAGESGVLLDEKFEKSKISLDIVTPADKGSLVVLLEASVKDNDMFDPYRLLTHALQKIDGSLRFARNSQNIPDLSKSFGPEYAQKFQIFMEAIERSDADLQYSWAEPRFQVGNIERVSLDYAKSVVNTIKAESNKTISEAEKSVSGIFIKFIQGTGRWGLLTDTGLIEGIVEGVDRETMLNGLVVGKKYKFDCIEKQSFDQAWRNARPTLILRQIHSL